MRFQLFAAAIFSGLLCFSQGRTINGYVRDASSGENLIGATVYDTQSGKGTITNTFGFFSLTLPAESAALRVTYVGYQNHEIELAPGADPSIEVKLELSDDLLDEVVIVGEEALEKLPQMSTIDVPIEQIKVAPVLFGETDILKTLQLLPGIQGGTEGSSGIYVRGGGPDQNLILLDGVPVYNVSHLFGFFSVFNADAINRVSVVKGGFPARYGGRLSSVIDISMKEGNNQKFGGEGSIGLISSKLTLEGPLDKKGKTSFIISGRRTYIDLLARPLIRAQSNGDETGGYYFYDVNAKINHTFSKKDRIYLSVYNGKDKGFAKSEYDYTDDEGQRFEYQDDFDLSWGNTISAFRWNHLFGPKLFSNLTATYSKYDFGVGVFYKENSSGPRGNENSDEFIEYTSGITDYSLKFDLDYLPHPDHNIKMGAHVTNHQFRPGIIAFNSESENDTTIGANRIDAIEYSLYAEDDFKISSKLRTNIGVHHSSFFVEGRSYSSVQPRVSLRYLLGKYALKASYSQMNQFIHLLTNGGIGLPTDLWVPATDKVLPQESWQVAIGLARTVQKYEISLEGYYKEMENLIEYKEGASFINTTSDWQTKVASGDGRSYGVEFLIQKKTGRLSGWLGYTWSRTLRQFDELNFGKEFPYKFDRRHDLSVVASYKVNQVFNISGTFVYGTGNAISLPVSSYESVNYGEINHYESRNGFRMRSYHRMDISMSWTKPKKWGSQTWSTGLYNAYNRRNPFFIDRANRNGQEVFVQYSLFPMIPFVSYGFKF